MGYIARWGPMGFVVSPSKIVPFNGFGTSIALKTDDGNNASGKAATNARGLELQSMTFSTKYMMAVGVDPRERFEAWQSQVGNSYPLYIGEKRFGPAKMLLESVSMSDLVMNNAGVFLSVTVSITLKEDSQEATKTTAAKSTTSSNSSGNTSTTNSAAAKAAATYAQTVAKKQALNATATKSDKSQKKPVSTTDRKLTK